MAAVTWSPTIRVNAPVSYDLQIFTRAVQVANDGTVRVSYYQFDSNLNGTTTTHLVHCHPGPQDCNSAASWSGNGDVQIGDTFQMVTAPFAGGYFVGDYEGLTDMDRANPGGFRPFFVMAQPQSARVQRMSSPGPSARTADRLARERPGAAPGPPHGGGLPLAGPPAGLPTLIVSSAI